ncbi:MAG: tryptophan 2,3-dioxygenase [Planctomycetes bacterium]|nr:tryptophan 2,3-dioxygenase [Planctomycetota bacterium]MCP4772573.1 tryptophan 2,3-dioxygenase [Planctomycetota bacterium]MCP4860883.1 tryptophan 2,3-dioxygenase [Planctomycetota bacterium]
MSERLADYDRLKMEELNYNSYLKVPELTSLQHLRSEPKHHDEMFFIVIHQSFELWFKEALHEVGLMASFLANDDVARSLKVLKRVQAIITCLTQQIQLLGTLTPDEFAGFREALGTGSGFQSVQFREMEFACGQRDPWFFQFFEARPDEKARLQARFESPSVYDCFLQAMARAGYQVPKEVLERKLTETHQMNDELVEVFRELYQDPKTDYHWVLACEALLDLDTMWSNFRSAHILMVSRTIGGKKGTGGSSGVPFLESRLPLRFFPELWEVRNSDWQK